MKLILASLETHPEKGGVGRYLTDYYSRFSGNEAEVLPVEWMTRGHWLLLVPRLWWRLRADAGAIVQVSHVLPVGTVAWLLRMFTGRSYVVSLHGMDFLRARAVPRKAWLMRRILNSALFVSTNSDALAEQVRAFAPGACVVTLHPCLPENYGARQVLLTASGEPSALRLLGIGRLVTRKGFATVIEALRDLPGATFTLVGDGPERARLEQLARECGVAERVRFLGQLTEERKRAALAEADVFVMPTQRLGADVEGFGIVYLEAQAMGKPVVAGEGIGVQEALHPSLRQWAKSWTAQELAVALPKVLEVSTGMQEAYRAFALQFLASTQAERFKTLLGLPAQQPRISIIIPAYQAAQTLPATLESLLAQTWRNMEIIVVDDASTDDTEAVVRRFGDRVRYHRLPENGDAPRARNIGFTLSSGEYVLFCDADIRLQPWALERMFGALQRDPGASYAYPNFRFGWKKFVTGAWSAERLRTRNFVHTTALIRREAAPHFDEQLKRFQDWDLWLQLLAQGKRGVWVPELLFTVQLRARGLAKSAWLPRFVHALPWKYLGWAPQRLTKYREASNIVRRKHGLPEL